MSVRETIRKARPTISEYQLQDGNKVWVRALSGTGRAAYSEYVSQARDNGGIRPEVIAAMGICEEDGTLAYDWRNPADLQELLEHLDGQDLDGIGLRLFEISGLTKRAVEEAEKN